MILRALPVILSVLSTPVLSAAGKDYSAPGSYPVGVRTLVLVDQDREDSYSGGLRTLVTEVWYPAVESARSAKKTTFSEFFGKYQAEAGQFVDHFGGKLSEVESRFRCAGVRGAALRQGVFPLLVFSHGNGGIRHQNIFQVEHLASHGYIVVSADHTGNAGLAPLPSGALPYDRSGRGRSARNRPRDVSFLITELLRRNAQAGSWLHKSLDGERIGLLGHSFGGFTVCKVAEADRRVKAILPMTVGYGRKTSVPMLLMLGEKDRTMGAAGNAVARLYYQGCEGPKHLVSLKRGGHFSFTDMDAIAPGFGDGIGGEEFLPIARAKSVVNAYSLAFFDHYLRADAPSGRYLRTNPDETEILLKSGNLPKLGRPSPAQVSPVKKKVLIITGDDVPAHDWRKTTPHLRTMLSGKDGSEVIVCEDPSILAGGGLSKYDAIVLNFRNPPPRDPGPAARKALAEYVKSGGGLVVVHFAIFAFPGWEEYRRIIGRVWVGRVSGKKISGHSPRGTFDVKVLDREHPAVAGLEDFTADDELYSKLQGEDRIRVLLDAHSEYSGKREPVAWARSYGKGRVLVTVLGHDLKSREVPAFKALLRQGTAWAAGRD
ncbi:MAG: alpha/beta fold hydrolase [Planctomycetota bacterium]|nr:alpha/beta fold hydrolase [Planctomycetota bacterium]MEE3297830.1 alpha/beta fold hydrolase [Planctomycetota bacterium]